MSYLMSMSQQYLPTKRCFSDIIINWHWQRNGTHRHMTAVMYAADAVMPRRSTRRRISWWANDLQIRAVCPRLLVVAPTERYILDLDLLLMYERLLNEVINKVVAELNEHHAAVDGTANWRCIDILTGRNHQMIGTVPAVGITGEMSAIQRHFSSILTASTQKNSMLMPPSTPVLCSVSQQFPSDSGITAGSQVEYEAGQSDIRIRWTDRRLTH